MSETSDSDTSSDDGLGMLTSEEMEILERRRTAELALIKKYDKTEIDPRRECWFIISSKWLKEWGAYMEGEGEAPPPVSNSDLYTNANGSSSSSASSSSASSSTPWRLRSGLVAKVDYRGLHPNTWFIFVELYGKDRAPELARYSLDVYAPAVVGTFRTEGAGVKGAALQARVAVAKMREAFLPESSSDDDDAGGDDGPLVCCLYRSHVEFLLFHCFTCCAHLGKTGPAYRALRQDYDGSDDELGMASEEDEDPNDPDRLEEEARRVRRSRRAARAKAKAAAARALRTRRTAVPTRQQPREPHGGGGVPTSVSSSEGERGEAGGEARRRRESPAA